MNILLINHYAGSLEHGMEFRPFYLAREWVKLGHHVNIVAGSFSHLRRNNPQNAESIRSELISGVKYTWLWTPNYQGNGIRRVCSMLAFPAQLFRYSHKILKQRYDVVVASSTYPFDIFPAHWLARRMNAKLAFEVHDLWPLSPMEIGSISRYHPFIMMLQFAENYAYRHSDTVISMLPKTLPHMVSHGLAPEKFHYIPNGISLDEWQELSAQLPAVLEKAINELKRANFMLVGYAGGLGASNAMEYLFQAADLLKSEKIAFFILGHGPEQASLQHYCAEKHLSNVRFFSPLPKNLVSQFLKQMDCLYIGWRKLRLYQYGISPNKVLDYMMSGRPILHSVSAGNDLVQDGCCGISVPAEDIQGIALGIKQLMNISSQERSQIGSKGRDYVLQHYTYNKLAQTFLNAIQNHE